MVGRPRLRRPRPPSAGVEESAGPRAGPAGADDLRRDREAVRRRPARVGARDRPPRLGRPARGEDPRAAAGVGRAPDGQPGGHARVPPDRGRRRHRAVELPSLHADGVDRVRAGRGQRRRLQAERAHPGRRDGAGRRAGRDRRGAAGATGRHRVRGDGRGAVPRAGRRQGRVHRLDGHGQARDGRLCREADTGAGRVRRQGPAARRRRRRSRRGGRRGRVGRDGQRRADVRRRRARVRARGRGRRVHGEGRGQGRGAAARRVRAR